MRSATTRQLTAVSDSLHKQREDWPIAVIRAALVHQLVRHFVVVDDDNLAAEDLEVEDVP